MILMIFIIYREPTILRNISSDFLQGIEQFQVLSIDSIQNQTIFIYKDVQIQFENQIPIYYILEIIFLKN